MENQVPIVAFPKKLWKVLRLFFFMVRNGVCKKKLLFHFNFLLKRSKLAGKALKSLMALFPNNHHDSSPDTTTDLFNLFMEASGRGEYEFSCSNTPAHHKYFLFHKKNKKDHYKTVEEEIVSMMAVNDVVEASSSSPVLPGLGIRVMGSPILNSSDWAGDEGDFHVDEAAEEFIRRFFSQLRKQALSDA